MKLQTITFAALIALSSTASANWFDGVNNGNGTANVAGNSAGDAQGNTTSKANGATQGNGWGTGKGDADGAVDFNVSFKGKGSTNMDTKAQLDGDTKVDADTQAKGAGNGNVAGNGAGNAVGANATNGQGSMSNVANVPGFAPAASIPQMKAALETQIKQAMEMLKRIEAQEKAVTPATSVEKKS